MSDFDHATMRDAFEGPDLQHVAMGTVDADTPDSPSVIFNDDDGNPLPFPLVMVTVQPRGITLPCRVASPIAGNGEGSWYPFAAGDEVAVVIPQGDEGEGGVIVGRMNQSLDKFPTLVAGSDATGNNFGFTRMLAPYIVETASSYMIRSAVTMSYMGIDLAGNITLVNGADNSMLHIGTDFLSLAAGDNSALVQVIQDKMQVFLQADGTQFLLDPNASTFLSSGSLSISTGGVGAVGHAVTAEQVAVLVWQALVAFGALVVPTPVTPAQALTAMMAALPLAGITPFTPLVGGFTTAIAAPPDPTGTIPGYGKSAFML